MKYTKKVDLEIEALETFEKLSGLTSHGNRRIKALRKCRDDFKQLNLAVVTQRSELFFAVVKWAKQADLDYPNDMLIKDFEQFTAKHSG